MLFPRRSKCIVIVILVLLIQYFVVLIVHSESDFTNIQEINILDDISKTKDFYKNIFKLNLGNSSTDALSFIEEKLESINLSNYHKFWKFHKELSGHDLEFEPKKYIEERSKHFYYDPRITYSVYLNHITKKFKDKNPKNIEETPENGIEHVKVPFSWTDWVDLSVLNKYLDSPEDERPSCETIMSYGLDYNPKNKDSVAKNKKTFKKKKPFDTTCTDLKDYTGHRDKKFMPGFGFSARSVKKTFLEKLLYAKSYMNAYAPIPASLYFISPQGSYEVLTESEGNIVETGMFDEYLTDANFDLKDEAQNSLHIDTTVEFAKLLKSIPGREISNDYDKLLNSENLYRFDIPEEYFTFDPEPIIEEYKKRIDNKEQLTNRELNHFNSLQYSLSIPDNKLTKYFYEVNINWPAKYNGHTVTENGGHYDWRFFNGFITESKINDFDDVAEKRRIILHRMLHSWLSFTYREGIITWLAHGSLLGWYWDGLSFVWDNDIDVQMPITELDRFALKYNNSLIIDNLENSYAKFYVDCGSFTTHRLKANGRNNIDARFIDVDSGFYIDITGLALSNSPNLPQRYIATLDSMGLLNPDPKDMSGKDVAKEIVDAADAEAVAKDVQKTKDSKAKSSKQLTKRAVRSSKKLQNLPKPEEALRRNTLLKAYNCRNNHFYRYEELSPLTFSMMEGAPTFIPKNFEDILRTEYKNGLSATLFNKHFYFPAFRLWIPVDKIVKYIRFKTGSGLRNNKIGEYVNAHTEEVILALLEDEEILKEFYFTRDVTRLHEEEMELLSKVKIKPSQSDIEKYQGLISKFSLMEPLRKDQFVYISEVLALARGETLSNDLNYHTFAESTEVPEDEVKQNDGKDLETRSYEKNIDDGFYYAQKEVNHNVKLNSYNAAVAASKKNAAKSNGANNQPPPVKTVKTRQGSARNRQAAVANEQK